MQLARRELFLDVEERAIDRSELFICDELFFTGTAVGIAPIARVNHRPVHDGAIGAVTRGIRSIYSKAAHGHLHDYLNWLTPVYQPLVEREQDLALLGEMD